MLTTTSYRAKATQDFLQNVVSDFVSAEECHILSRHEPLDYSVWDILQVDVLT